MAMSRIAMLLALLMCYGVAAGVMEDAYDIQGCGGEPFLEDFDVMGPFGRFAPGATFFTTYWSVIGNGVETAQGLDNAEGTGAGGDDWGGRPNGYNSAGFAGDEDRALAIFKTAVGETASMTCKLQNNTGQVMTHVTMTVDYEIHWYRHKAIDEFNHAYLDFAIRADDSSWETVHTSRDFDNTDPNIEILTWYTDEETAEFGGLQRGKGGVYELPEPLQPGEFFFFRWGGYDQESGRRLNTGIDNLKVVFTESWGDANVDGVVDVGDLGILASSWGAGSDGDEFPAEWGQGDFNGDGVVDVGDLGVLASNWGNDAYDCSTVPEPASGLLLVMGGLGIVSRRSRQQRESSRVACRR
jgi:hypothetical protein